MLAPPHSVVTHPAYSSTARFARIAPVGLRVATVLALAGGDCAPCYALLWLFLVGLELRRVVFLRRKMWQILAL